ncbi:hypothetical protein [Pandoravirus japonicus]|uniref:Uncharacterized protein n=1 Tax=Pandoravirus japonicus TaxID=2823154 RepID=A0A811BSY7_9VIRU|nr:hypothetical protein [Pandoravirus japonicus]
MQKKCKSTGGPRKKESTHRKVALCHGGVARKARSPPLLFILQTLFLLESKKKDSTNTGQFSDAAPLAAADSIAHTIQILCAKSRIICDVRHFFSMQVDLGHGRFLFFLPVAFFGAGRAPFIMRPARV